MPDHTVQFQGSIESNTAEIAATLRSNEAIVENRVVVCKKNRWMTFQAVPATALSDSLKELGLNLKIIEAIDYNEMLKCVAHGLSNMTLRPMNLPQRCQFMRKNNVIL